MSTMMGLLGLMYAGVYTRGLLDILEVAHVAYLENATSLLGGMGGHR